MNIATINEIAKLMIDKMSGRLSNATDTFLFINLVPFIGIIKFQEPEIGEETELLYSNYSNIPQGLVRKNVTIGEGSITILESSLLKAKATGFRRGSPISITKLISGKVVLQDLRELKIYEGVYPTKESRPELNNELMAYTVDVGLTFTKEPFVLQIPI